MRGLGVGEMETLEGLEQAEGGRGQREALYLTPHWSPLPLGCSSTASAPHSSREPPPCYPFHPSPGGSHSWRKRHCSSHCRTGGGTGCSESACSLLGPVRTRTCTWGSLQGSAGQGWGCSSGPRKRVSFFAMRDYWAPYLCHFPEGTSPSPGLGILGHWCVSSSGNLHSSGLGAVPPTARRKQASHESSMPGPSCWPPYSDPVALTQYTALPSTMCSNTKLKGQPWFSHLFTPDTFTSKSRCCHFSPAPLFFIPTLNSFTLGQASSRLGYLP